MDYKWSVSHFALIDASEVSLSEYGTTSKRLGEVFDEHPNIVYSRRNSPRFCRYKQVAWRIATGVFITTLFYSILNLTMRIPLLKVYCAFSALAYPTKLSLASNAILPTVIRGSPLVTQNDS